MYHDQGLPVLKAASFGGGVNVTLGLPFIRTSVDHGTALDLALDPERAKTADAGSLVAAVDLAVAARRRRLMRACTVTRHAGDSARTSPTRYVERIVAAIDPRPETIVEIGPGWPRSQAVDRATAFDRDRDRSRPRRAAARALFDGATHARARRCTRVRFASLGHDLRVVGNLPYNISSPLLFHLAGLAASLRDLHVMLQREVVDRMTAIPATRIREADGDAAMPFRDRASVRRSSRRVPPVPKVDSAVARLVPLRDRAPRIDDFAVLAHSRGSVRNAARRCAMHCRASCLRHGSRRRASIRVCVARRWRSRTSFGSRVR